MSTSIVRRPANEFVTLRDAMDRLFDESFLQPFGNGDWAGSAAPAVDVAETADKITVTATVPGVKPDDIKITLTGDILQISGESKAETEREEATYHVRERRFGSFSRAIALPTTVLADKVAAEFENGVLKLTLPKAEEVRPKAIKVVAK